MIQFLGALAEVLPAAGKFIDAITKHEDKASTAAKVAADPNAPPDVKAAAKNVAATAIADKAAAEQAALTAAVGSGRAPASSGNNTAILIGLGALFLLSKRR